jgi:HPt (histidine-containing phosphotransfer) domain-containing protein
VNDDLDAELAALCAEYARALPDRAEAIARAVEDARRDPSLREAASALAHLLAGTAGSYGFAEVSAIARRLETGLDGGAEPSTLAADVEALRKVSSEAAR